MWLLIFYKTPQDKKSHCLTFVIMLLSLWEETIKPRNPWNNLTCLFSKAQWEIYRLKRTSSVNITVSSASLPLTGEERAGNVAADRLLRVSAGDDRGARERDLKDRCLSRIAAFFFLQPLLVPTKAQQRLKCLCLSPDNRRQAGRNTSMSVLSRLSWLSPLPTLCRSRAAAGQGWQIHWNKQTNCKFGFSSQIYFQVSLISWVSSQDKRPIHMINIPVTDTDDVCCL